MPPSFITDGYGAWQHRRNPARIQFAPETLVDVPIHADAILEPFVQTAPARATRPPKVGFSTWALGATDCAATEGKAK
jgi:hypothetical protein